MDTRLIKERELKNDAQHVHLYRMNDSDVWVAYGHSAYSLRLCAKSLGYDNLRGFSTSMGMPYTMVSFREVKRLRRRVTIEHEDDNYVYYVKAVPKIGEVTNNEQTDKETQMSFKNLRKEKIKHSDK